MFIVSARKHKILIIFGFNINVRKIWKVLMVFGFRLNGGLSIAPAIVNNKRYIE
jgi:hypothetical protein